MVHHESHGPIANAETAPNRRTLIAAAGIAAAAASLPAAPASAADAKDELVSETYTAKKGAVTLAMYRRRKKPVAGAAPQPVLFLTHGSSLSASSSFDLHVPGAGEYSVMNIFAGYGYDVWTMDFEGYGRSTVTDGNSDIKTGVQDLVAATPVIARETGQEKFHFFGESSGGLRAGAFAVAQPQRVDRLIVAAFTYTGKGSPTLTQRAKRLDYYRTHNRRVRDRKMIESIFTRDKPGTSDQRVAEALAKSELRFGETVPTGTYLDMTANLPVVDPKKLQCPTQVLKGQYDGIATEADLLDFFRQLPSPDRQLAILPGLAHSLFFGINRACFYHAAHAFLTMPKPTPV